MYVPKLSLRLAPEYYGDRASARTWQNEYRIYVRTCVSIQVGGQGTVFMRPGTESGVQLMR